MSAAAAASAACELTILMPCLDEAETLRTCIAKAQAFLRDAGVDGEVLVADNGSIDSSPQQAEAAGARVVHVAQRGYGSALQAGIQAARGTYVIMGDADDSYDFRHLQPFLDRLRTGDQLVMGNRFKGGIAPGAMPPLHRYLGNPVLSFLGRAFYGAKVGDFHCGLRGFHRRAVLDLGLQSVGMEYASEMVVQATLHGLRISEVPTTLSKDGRDHRSHLRSFPDGWRHLKFLLMCSPNWLFFYPGYVLLALGLVAMVLLECTNITWGATTFSIHTLLYAAACVVLGFTSISYGYLTRLYAKQSGYIPDARMPRVLERLTLERGIVASLVLVAVGVGLSAYAVWLWGGDGVFKDLDPAQMMRLIIPAVALMIVGVQLFFLSFFASILRTER